jgi:hypothetical protein
MSTKPRLIEVTRLADKTITGDEKKIENAKTGKVTAVVAVMYYFSSQTQIWRVLNMEHQPCMVEYHNLFNKHGVYM